METYEQKAWDLAAIAPLATSFTDIETAASAIEQKREQLTDDITTEQFLAILKEIEELRKTTAHLSCHAYLKFCEDQTNQEATAQLSKVENFLAKIQNRLLFFSLWFKDLPQEKAQELTKASGKYAYYFEYLTLTKKFTLKENEEQIINLKNTTGVSALNTIYDILTSKFTYTFNGKEITQQELVNKVRDNDPKVREQAYKELLKHYQNNQEVIAEIYKNIVLDWYEENVHLRTHHSPISVRNVYNDIPDAAIEALLHVTKKNQHLFHQFFEIKRKKLGLEKLRRFDIYAPVKEEKVEISYDEAVKMTLAAFEQFSPVFKEEMLNIINANKIHSTIQKNKRTGAFCMSVTAKENPYILLNYANDLRDVATLAHEVGHGIHHNLAREQTEFTSHSALPLAETASIFGEMLLTDYLFATRPREAHSLIFSKLDDIYASIIRQAGFVAFEKKAHAMIKEGKTLKELNEVYLADLKEQLGPDVEVDAIFQHEWSYIPHIFHTPFYCYAYAFGNLLVLALYEMYKEEGKTFVPKLIEMLSKGGSDSPVNITKAIGVDITSQAFWQKAFDAIKQMMEKIS